MQIRWWYDHYDFLLCGTIQRPNVPSVIFVVLFAQEPSNLGPNGPNIRRSFTYERCMREDKKYAALSFFFSVCGFWLDKHSQYVGCPNVEQHSERYHRGPDFLLHGAAQQTSNPTGWRYWYDGIQTPHACCKCFDIIPLNSIRDWITISQCFFNLNFFG